MSTTVAVAIDGSDASTRALDAAVQLASSLGGALTVIHVREGSDYSHGGGARPEVPSDAQALVNAALATAVQRGVEAVGDIAVSEASIEDVSRLIAQRARVAEADYLVCGTRGRGELGSALLGSIAHELIRVADMPVMVIR